MAFLLRLALLLVFAATLTAPAFASAVVETPEFVVKAADFPRLEAAQGITGVW